MYLVTKQVSGLCKFCCTKFKDLKRAIKVMVCLSKASFFTGKVTSSDFFAVGSTALKS